ncbi:Hypothetical protein CINCED_3A022852 [Cinara cedri]|uniref:Uncharacterized protein n=1 Tax=Cinara cedri TaxID=506608 RepID=A0A5E4MZI4_9HEMI|nr:Hypothetical protein CINCED_3A022852 [Cinara cedri]
MNHHYQIFTLCVFVFTKYQIVQGWFFNNPYGDIASANIYNQQSPPGYHFESLAEIEQNYDPNTYSIVPLDQALSMYTYGTTANALGSRSQDGTGGNHNGGVDKRKKRGYFPSLSLPYFTNNNTPTSTSTITTTANIAEDASTKNVNGVPVNTNKADNTFVSETTAIDGAKNQGFNAKAETEAMHFLDFGEGIKNYVSTGTEATITDTAAVTKNTIDTVSAKTQGVIANTESAVSTAISIGEDIEHGLVIIGPYLPLVYKVAMYIIPSLTPYQTIQLSWEVSQIMVEAMKNYEEGESLTRVTAVAAAKIAYDAYLRKRDTGATIINNDFTATTGPATITEYATDIYEKLKDMFNDKSGTSPLSIFSGMNPSPDNNNIVYDANGKSVETKTFDNGAEILHSSDNKILLREPSWKLNKVRELDSQIPKLQNNYEKPSDDDDDNDNDDESEGKVVRSVKTNNDNLSTNANIDKTRFDELLNESMKYQPSFIRNTDGEVLVEQLSNKKSKIPASVNVDSGARFAALTSTMEFTKDVTDDQINELVNLMSKATDYFILKAIRDKKSANRVKS